MDYIKSNQINLIIASGGPFSSNYCAARIKKKLPYVKVIHDFRDVWTEEYFFEYPNRLKGGRLHKKELAMEKFSLQNCDVIESVTPGCLARLKLKAEEGNVKNKKYVLIENGFDEEDKVEFNSDQYPINVFKKCDLNISHFGTAGFGREVQFFEFLESIEKSIREYDLKICFHFFGSFGSVLKEQILSSTLREFVKFYDFLPSSEIQLFMYFSDIHLVINDKVSYYAYGSKIYDAFMYHRPVILISKEESLYDIITNNKIGLATNNTHEQNSILITNIIQNYNKIKNNTYFNSNFNYGVYSIKELTKKLESLIDEMLNPKEAESYV